MSVMTAPVLPFWIGGAEVMGTSGRVGDVFDPALGQVIRRVSFAGPSDVDRAVVAAQAALPGWRGTPPLRRARILARYRELLESHRAELARLITQEHGKTLPDAAGSLQRGIEVVEFAEGIPHLLKGEHSEDVAGGVDSHSVLQPVGVCAGITPFNFPAMVPMWMFPMAIACGNTFVLKPSEKDPSTSLLLARLFHEAGLPAGVLNVLLGDGDAVNALLSHPGVNAVSFVGSTPIARHVYETSARAGKRVQALGGGKEPRRGPARLRAGVHGQCAHRRRLRVGRRALHGDLGSRGGGRGRRPPRGTAAPEGSGAESRPWYRGGRGDGASRHRRSPRPGSRAHRERDPGGGEAGPRRAGPESSRLGERIFSRSDALRRRDDVDDGLP